MIAELTTAADSAELPVAADPEKTDGERWLLLAADVLLLLVVKLLLLAVRLLLLVVLLASILLLLASMQFGPVELKRRGLY